MPTLELCTEQFDDSGNKPRLSGDSLDASEGAEAEKQQQAIEDQRENEAQRLKLTDSEN